MPCVRMRLFFEQLHSSNQPIHAPHGNVKEIAPLYSIVLHNLQYKKGDFMWPVGVLHDSQNTPVDDPIGSDDHIQVPNGNRKRQLVPSLVEDTKGVQKSIPKE